MLTLYNLFNRLYFIGVLIASLWNKKAAAWIAGRKGLFEDLQKAIDKKSDYIWMHCASAGEFEQGKPLIEALKKEYPAYKMLVSFFSPSGFSAAQNYEHVDHITYLPSDTKKNAKLFLETVKPKLVIFVKYEFWYHHLAAVAHYKTPALLVSAVFRKDQVFFKSHGKFFRQLLFFFWHIFVQDKRSLELLKQHNLTHSSIGGDTRFDRVMGIQEKFSEIDSIINFRGNKTVLVAGSTWEGDEILLAAYAKEHTEQKLIIAPHEINDRHVSNLKKLLPNSVLYSENSRTTNSQDAQTLIIDSVGLLSRLYKYATVTYIGGGFTRDGIHNILEAAVWSKPVVFGPNFKKYREASELIKAGGGFSIKTTEELKNIITVLSTDEDYLRSVGTKARNFIEENTGATQKILQAVQENRLLTRL